MYMRKVVTALGAAAALLLGMGMPAMAASGAGTDSTSSTDRFAAQAHAAHLTNAQVNSLRAEVGRIVAETGGKQVALNKIDLNGRGEVLVAVPGEAHPRDFSSPSGVLYDPCLEGSVYSGYFCAYQYPNYSGTEYQMYTCGSYGIPWSGNGSWINDQTPGTRARFYRNDGSLLYTTPAPYSYNPNYSSWTNVHTIRPC